MTKPAYKLAHIDETKVALAAREGLMVADSHFPLPGFAVVDRDHEQAFLGIADHNGRPARAAGE